MGDKKKQQVDRMLAYARVLEKQAGKAVRPYRADGYMNLLNRYGTSKDSGEAYRFVPEATIPDESLTMFYEGNGLFAKIIDAPAEEALKHGFCLDDVSDQEVEDFYREALDELDWEETAMTAIKWARLFGGSLAVMLINDGRGLDEPLDWKNIKSIDDIRVYDRSVIQPDHESMFHYDPRDPFSTRGSRLGMPERYSVYSRYGTFTVHESRCLVFQNGLLPENSSNSIYQFWGMPEYVRIHRAIQDAEIAHRSAPRMLDRSVQPVYKMKDLASELATDEGENKVLKRLQAIDMARGMMNSITIDSEGEDYDFRSFQFAGVADVIDSACNYLSALTNIPQTILFGRSPAGMNSTGESDLENWYNFVERIQKRMLKSNLRYLLSVIFQAGVATGEVDEVPKIKVKFNPLWSLSDTEQAELEQKKATTAQTRAQTVQIYVDMQAIDPTEVRRKLADSSEFDVETLLDEYEDEDDLLAAYTGQVDPGAGPSGIFESGDFAEYAQGVDIDAHATDPGSEGSAPANAPAATKLPQDMSAEEKAEAEQNGPVAEQIGTEADQGAVEAAQKAAKAAQNNDAGAGYSNTQGEGKPFSVGVLVISEGKVLTGTRHNDFGYGLICGPGGHGEKGETPEQAAFRETEEEFGISPNFLIPLGTGPVEPDTGLTPHLFLCTDYEGEPDCVDLEMTNAKFRTLEELDQLAASMFQPFADGLEILKTCIDTALFFGDDGGEMHDELVESVGKAVSGTEGNSDGGPGSGNHGHQGVPGEIGGSLPTGKSMNDDIQKSYKTGDYTDVGKTIRKTLADAPIGTKFRHKGDAFTKTGDNEFTAEGNGRKSNANMIANGTDPWNPETAPVFEDPKPSDVAEAKVISGEIEPEETSVKTAEYNGETSEYVSKKTYSEKKAQFQNNAGREFSDDEVAEMVDAVTYYTSGDYMDVLAAQTGFGGRYEGYASMMSEAERAKAVRLAEATENALKYSDKYTGTVKRAMGFDLDGVSASPDVFAALDASLVEGNTISMGAMSSWTTSDSIVDQVMTHRIGLSDEATRAAKVVMTCQSKTGVDINNMSCMNQSEVLFSKDAQFRVKSVKRSTGTEADMEITTVEVELEEVT